MRTLIPEQRYYLVPLKSGRWGLFDRQLNNAVVKYGTKRELELLRLRLCVELRQPTAAE